MTTRSPGTLRQDTINAVAWTSIEQALRQGVNFGVSVILARILNPSEFGLMGMIAVFTGFAALFGEVGLSAALVQRKDVDERHYSSVFWFNMGAGVMITAILIVLAPVIATFYSEPALHSLVIVVAFNFLINPLSQVQTAILSRGMRFRCLSTIQIVALATSACVAIVLALSGFGVWALVFSSMAASVTSVIGLWYSSTWRPAREFHLSAIRQMLGFSGNLFGFRVFNYWVRNVDNLVVGKLLGTASLGVYTRAYGTMLLPVSQVGQVLGRVMFPALARVQDDRPKVKSIYLRAIATIAFLTFPMMTGLFVVAEQFVVVVYGSKWAEVVPILRILCFVGMLQSIGSTVGWIYQSQGRTDLMFRWGVAAGVAMIASIVLGAWMGTLEAVAGAYAFTSGVLLLYPAFAIPGKLIGMSFNDVVKSVGGVAGCAAAMGLAVWGMQMLIVGFSPALQLFVLVVTGISVYLTLVAVLKIEAYRFVRDLVSKQLQQRRQRQGTSMLDG